MHDPRFLFWMIKQDHLWWICEYADGTKVYNNFRSYRNVDEVKDYFVGLQKGDCDAFVINQQGERETMCYDESSAKKHIKEHGEIVSIRLDKKQ